MDRDIAFKIYSELDEELQERIAKFRDRCKRNEPKRKDGDRATRLDKYCSDADIFKWIVARDSDEIVGMVAAYKRNILYLGEELVMGGIGKMRVSLEYQRRGIASKLMGIVISELKAESVDVALLCTNIDSFLVNFYEKFGFKLLGKPYRYKGKSGKDYTELEGMLAPINSKSKFKTVMSSEHVLDIGVGNW